MDASDEPSAASTERVRAEQVRLLYANGGFPLIATFAAAGVLTGGLALQGAMRPLTAEIWLAVMAAQTLARWGLRWVYFRADPPAAAWRAWMWRYTAGAMAGGLTWGLGTVALMPPGRADLQFLIVLVAAACACAAIATFGSMAGIFYAFFVAVIAPSVIWALVQGDALHLTYALLAVIWVPTVLVLARRYNATLVRVITLQHAYAEQRAVAEQASLAKSRFLASASHDLRQPVHALGLFLGALRGHRLPARSREVIDNMDASLAALDGLFSALLDISRLDAGVTEVRLAPTPLEPMLARICREAGAEATAKRLRLTHVATSLAVESDPVLLERIVRNLVANAVRYTDRGRVLVGCRRTPAGVTVEVRDTGRGIAPEHQGAVFEEFFQVGNADRDRAGGLGLGLAIVRRLTDMLGHPLSVQSRLGQGSVFRVSAPRIAPPPAAAPEAPAHAAGVRPGLILAIDDEAPVRAAMVGLLQGWGHKVLACGGGGEALAALARQGARPDLIICDYRLRDGEDGLSVIRRLQAELGEEVPALLLTGDTAPERLREAEGSGLPLLHKPLAHARLRAAVQNLMARGRAAATVE